MEQNENRDSRLLQFHADQLYKFLNEYKKLQEQMQTIRKLQETHHAQQQVLTSNSCVENTNSGALSSADNVLGIQSSIEYLLAHRASIPPPIIETINQLSSNKENIDAASSGNSNCLTFIPPPPNYSTGSAPDPIFSQSSAINQSFHVPSSVTTAQVIPTTALTTLISPPNISPVNTQCIMFDNCTCNRQHPSRFKENEARRCDDGGLLKQDTLGSIVCVSRESSVSSTQKSLPPTSLSSSSPPPPLPKKPSSSTHKYHSQSHRPTLEDVDRKSLVTLSNPTPVLHANVQYIPSSSSQDHFNEAYNNKHQGASDASQMKSNDTLKQEHHRN